NFSGFQFGVGYSFNVDGGQEWKESGTDDANKRAITTGLRYANGPLAVALTYDTFKVKGATAEAGTTQTGVTSTGVPVFGYTAAVNDGQDSTVKVWNLGTTYDFEVVNSHLAFGQTRNGYFAGNDYGGESAFKTPTFGAAEGLKINSYLVGLSAPIGNGKIL